MNAHDDTNKPQLRVIPGGIPDRHGSFPSEEARNKDPIEQVAGELDDTISIFHPGSKAVTTTFLLLMIGTYIVTSWESNLEHIDPWAASLGIFSAALWNQGEWWRAITANLMHAHLPHIANNAFGIFIFGQLLEPIITGWPMLLLIALSGAAAMAASYFGIPGFTLGASGIVYGLIGAYITIAILMNRKLNPKQFWGQLRGAIMYVLVFLLLNWMDQAEVNLWAHLAGFGTGVLFGLLWCAFLPKHPTNNLLDS